MTGTAPRAYLPVGTATRRHSSASPPSAPSIHPPHSDTMTTSGSSRVLHSSASNSPSPTGLHMTYRALRVLPHPPLQHRLPRLPRSSTPHACLPARPPASGLGNTLGPLFPPAPNPLSPTHPSGFGLKSTASVNPPQFLRQDQVPRPRLPQHWCFSCVTVVGCFPP